MEWWWWSQSDGREKQGGEAAAVQPSCSFASVCLEAILYNVRISKVHFRHERRDVLSKLSTPRRDFLCGFHEALYVKARKLEE